MAKVSRKIVGSTRTEEADAACLYREMGNFLLFDGIMEEMVFHYASNFV
ncbi:hypothetical protein C8K44_109227 [Aminobacter sp. AP02]|nr:hypothetical protein C8K44_109227 [Aminobacter sp. AP02]